MLTLLLIKSILLLKQAILRKRSSRSSEINLPISNRKV